MLTTSDTRRAKASSLTKEHRAPLSLAGPVGRDTGLGPISLPILVRSRAVPQQLQQHFRQLFTARGESAAGAVRQGAKARADWMHPLCWFATGTPMPRNLQELWVTLLSPGCAKQRLFGGCKHQMLPKTMLAISPTNQEAVLVLPASTLLQDARTALPPHLAC